MKAFLIDPAERTITQIDIDYEKRGIQAIYDAGEYDCFDTLRISEHDLIYLDDTGLFKPLVRFGVEGYPNLLAGKGVVLAHDERGETIEPMITLPELKQLVFFVD